MSPFLIHTLDFIVFSLQFSIFAAASHFGALACTVKCFFILARVFRPVKFLECHPFASMQNVDSTGCKTNVKCKLYGVSSSESSEFT